MQEIRVKRIGLVVSGNNMPIGERDNINGPCCIEVPQWCKQRLGRFYLYFADHQGRHIKMAFSDQLHGPWSVYAGGVLSLSRFSDAHDHIASPEIYIDDAGRKLRLYFHARSKSRGRQQWTYAALSDDGIRFDDIYDYPLAPFYLRVFRRHGYFYGMSKGGNLWRSRDGLTLFEPGPNPFRPELSHELWHNEAGSIRHLALNATGDVLGVFYSRIGDAPERIVSSRIHVADPDWNRWSSEGEEEVIRATEPYEGGDLPVTASSSGPAQGEENALRDPYVLNQDGKEYLFYTVRGEKGIALCELVR